MNVLSLFDGMSCGMIAMKNANIDVERYVAYENDGYAIKTATHNFPNIEEMGDVFDGDYTRYAGFDFLVGGSPCTYWSIAQRNEKREKVASGLGWELFSQYVRALKESKPKYFIYENNKSMSKAIKDSITDTFGFEPICINSALVSAQNRNRLYWVGKRVGDEYVKVNVTQPDDKGVLLKDVLDNSSSRVPSDKAYCISSTEWKGQSVKGFLTKHRRQKVFDEVPLTDREIAYMCRDHADRRWNYMQRPGEDDKAKCLTANMCRGVPYNVCANPVLEDNDQKSYTVKDGMIDVEGKMYPIKLADGLYTIRKLSVQECMRLQTVPDWYEFPVSNTQAYKLLGNGWTCDVITHIIKCCLYE